jgi:hypothetical protein
VTKIILHRKLSNLGVKLFDLAVFGLSLFDLVRENACHAFNRLPFPRAHLLWIHLGKLSKFTGPLHFLNGLLCNGLVCLAIWTAARKSSDMAKIAIIWFCLYAVIAAGFEHPIANMTVFSVALLSDLPTTITLGGTAWSLFFIGIDLAKQSFQLNGALPDGSGGFCKRLSRPQLLAFLADIPDRSVAL